YGKSYIRFSIYQVTFSCQARDGVHVTRWRHSLGSFGIRTEEKRRQAENPPRQRSPQASTVA
ncbi:hypothetical protein ACYTTR_16625, partial [Cobetia marina]